MFNFNILLNLFFFCYLLKNQFIYSADDIFGCYKKCYSLPNKRINITHALYTLTLLSTFYYIMKKNLNYINSGKNYNSWFSKLNAHKDISYKVSLWSKNLFIPLTAYTFIGYHYKKHKEQNLEERCFLKILKNESINGKYKDDLNIDIKNNAQQSILYNFLYDNMPNAIMDKINNFINNYCNFTDNDHYNNNIALLKKEIECLGQNIEILKYNSDDSTYNDSQKKVKCMNKNLFVKFKKNFKFYLLATIITNITILFLIYNLILIKKYIAENGLDNNNFLANWLYENRLYKLAGMIFSNVDRIYWTCGFFIYIISPLLFIYTTISFMNYNKGNHFRYNIIQVIIQNINILNNDAGNLEHMTSIFKTLEEKRKFDSSEHLLKWLINDCATNFF